MGPPSKRQTLQKQGFAHARKLISRGKVCQKSTAKTLLPPLHIKLGLMKNFVKAMKKKGIGFKCLRETFPKLSDAKLSR
jgi:hypothetical protein